MKYNIRGILLVWMFGFLPAAVSSLCLFEFVAIYFRGAGFHARDHHSLRPIGLHMQYKKYARTTPRTVDRGIVRAGAVLEPPSVMDYALFFRNHVHCGRGGRRPPPSG